MESLLYDKILFTLSLFYFLSRFKDDHTLGFRFHYRFSVVDLYLTLEYSMARYGRFASFDTNSDVKLSCHLKIGAVLLQKLTIQLLSCSIIAVNVEEYSVQIAHQKEFRFLKLDTVTRFEFVTDVIIHLVTVLLESHHFTIIRYYVIEIRLLVTGLRLAVSCFLIRFGIVMVNAFCSNFRQMLSST